MHVSYIMAVLSQNRGHMGGTIEATRRAVLAALEKLGGGWHSRADLARAMDKARLNLSEITILETLVEAGKVAKQSTQPTPGSNAYMYRLK